VTENTPWHVYLLQCADGTRYCGIAKDVQKRLRQHNGQLAGGARYTSGRRPVKLLAFVSRSTQSEALRLEAAIKKMPRDDKLHALVENQTCLPLE